MSDDEVVCYCVRRNKQTGKTTTFEPFMTAPPVNLGATAPNSIPVADFEAVASLLYKLFPEGYTIGNSQTDPIAGHLQPNGSIVQYGTSVTYGYFSGNTAATGPADYIREVDTEFMEGKLVSSDSSNKFYALNRTMYYVFDRVNNQIRYFDYIAPDSYSFGYAVSYSLTGTENVVFNVNGVEGLKKSESYSEVMTVQYGKEVLSRIYVGDTVPYNITYTWKTLSPPNLKNDLDSRPLSDFHVPQMPGPTGDVNITNIQDVWNFFKSIKADGYYLTSGDTENGAAYGGLGGSFTSISYAWSPDVNSIRKHNTKCYKSIKNDQSVQYTLSYNDWLYELDAANNVIKVICNTNQKGKKLGYLDYIDPANEALYINCDKIAANENRGQAFSFTSVTTPFSGQQYNSSLVYSNVQQKQDQIEKPSQSSWKYFIPVFQDIQSLSELATFTTTLESLYAEQKQNYLDNIKKSASVFAPALGLKIPHHVMVASKMAAKNDKLQKHINFAKNMHK